MSSISDLLSLISQAIFDGVAFVVEKSTLVLIDAGQWLNSFGSRVYLGVEDTLSLSASVIRVLQDTIQYLYIVVSSYLKAFFTLIEAPPGFISLLFWLVGIFIVVIWRQSIFGLLPLRIRNFFKTTKDKIYSILIPDQKKFLEEASQQGTTFTTSYIDYLHNRFATRIGMTIMAVLGVAIILAIVAGFNFLTTESVVVNRITKVIDHEDNSEAIDNLEQELSQLKLQPKPTKEIIKEITTEHTITEHTKEIINNISDKDLEVKEDLIVTKDNVIGGFLSVGKDAYFSGDLMVSVSPETNRPKFEVDSQTGTATFNNTLKIFNDGNDAKIETLTGKGDIIIHPEGGDVFLNTSLKVTNGIAEISDTGKIIGTELNLKGANKTNKVLIEQNDGTDIVNIATDTPAITINAPVTLTSLNASQGYTQTGASQNTLTGNIDATSGIDVTGANFTVGGTNFKVEVANGNITTLGNLTVTGDIQVEGSQIYTGGSTFNSDLVVNGDSSLNGDLAVTGAITFADTQTFNTATLTELAYLSGTTSAIQTQLNSKLNMSGDTMTGLITLSGAPTASLHAATKLYVDDQILTMNQLSELTDTNLTSLSNNDLLKYQSSTGKWVNTALSAGDMPSSIDATKLANGDVSNTEFQYLDGVTSALQTQLNAKEGTLTNSAGLLSALNDETGTGSAVFGTGPTFTTSLTSPLVIGGTATTSDLSFQTTSGVGATGADMHFLVGNNGATEAMTISNDGKVGIGTTGPGANLHLKDNASGEILRLEGASTAGASTAIDFYTPAASGTSTYFSGRIYAVADGGTDYSNQTLRIASPIGASATPTDVMTFKGGNVGIGTTTPGNKLSINNQAGGGTIPALGANGGLLSLLEAGNYGLLTGPLSTGNGFIQAQRIDGTGTAFNLLLQPNGGLVGINTTSPTSQLSFGEALGSELTTNGTFTGDASSWTLNSGWAYNSNAVDHSGSGTGTLTPNPALSVTAGNTYKVVYTISNWTSGTSVTPAIGGKSGAAVSANGTYTEYITAGTTGNLTFTPAGTSVFTIDSISVKLVTNNLDTVAGTGPLTINKTLSNATSNEAAMVLSYTTNKATSGNDTGLLVNMTDTASPGTSYLMDLQVGGVTKAYLDNGGIWGGYGMYPPTAADISFTSRTNKTLYINANPGSSTSVIPIHFRDSGSNSFSNTSGSRSFLAISPTYNQTSGTAANTDLLINRTETAVGSGAQLLIDAQVGSTTKFKVTNTGTVGIATLAGASGTTLCYDTTTLTGLNTFATCSSLRAYKDNIQPLNLGLDTLMRLDPVTYNWKNTGEADLGFIAEDVYNINPILASYYQGKLNGVKYEHLTALLTKSIQELNTEFTDQTKEIETKLNELTLKINQNTSDIEILKAGSSYNPFTTTELTAIKGLLASITQTDPTTTSMALTGTFTAKTIETESLTIKNTTEEQKTIGEAIITPVTTDTNNDGIDDITGSDGKSVVVETKAVGEKSKIFVTPKVTIEQSLAIIEIEAGKGFKVALKNISEEAIPFDWWIVEEK